MQRCGFEQRATKLTDNVDTVPFAIGKSNAVYIKARGFTMAGGGSDFVVRQLDEEGLYVPKSFAWRADNDNPLVPLFLEIAKQ